MLIDQQRVDAADIGDYQFLRHRYDPAKTRIDVLYGEHGRMGKEQVAQRIFAAGNALGFAGNEQRAAPGIKESEGHRSVFFTGRPPGRALGLVRRLWRQAHSCRR